MKVIFGAVISIVLLLIYVYLIYTGIDILVCAAEPACSDHQPDEFNDRMASSLALISGLISALVIAELATTKPGEAPAARLLTTEQKQGPVADKVLKGITGIYLSVWLLAGLAAFFYGYLLHPGVLPPMGNLGQAWLGIAVGAGYAYFGIERE